MITFHTKGSFRKTKKMLERAEKCSFYDILDKYAIKGLLALELATPENTGKTAKSWGYKVEVKRGSARIIWTNSSESDGIPITILLQYGHATKNGGWVEGRDFINPAIQPIFDEIADKAWKEVTGQ